MAEQPLDKSLEENQPAAQSNIEVGGNVGGHLVSGNNNVVGNQIVFNITPEQQVFRSLHQLPQPPADFTGREELIAQLLADFEKGKGATITGQPIHGLVGMGGIGKTALGLVVAHQLKKDYPDAQIFLDLKGTTTPLSAADIMRHVILSFEPKMDVRTLEEANVSAMYLSVLEGKRALLYLDNARSAEQIVPLRPPKTCAMLLTSRWSFGVPGLKNHRVDVISGESAEEFLLELCPRIGDKANDLARACAYLPLALRIAGSFLGVNENLPINQCIQQLNDRKGRLAILQENREEAELKTEPDLLATFEMSYNQLSEEDQKRWRMLGVFPTSFAASAAAAVWEMDAERDAARKPLGILLRYSLLDYDGTSSRYSLHDLLSDYALSQMKEEEEREARMQHAAHYKNILRAANQLYREGGEKVLTGLGLFDLEWKNIRAGQAWVSLNSDDKNCLELCNEYAEAGYLILNLRLHPREYIVWSEQGLAAARKLGNKVDEGFTLGYLGNAYYSLGEAHKAIEFYEEYLAIARQLGVRLMEGYALRNLGVAYDSLGEVRKAIEFHEQALVFIRETGNRRSEGAALGDLGNAYLSLGEAHKAIEFNEQYLAIAREIGDRRGEGSALGNLGNAYLSLGEVRKAIEFYEEYLAIARQLGVRRMEGYALSYLGNAYADLAEVRKAIEFHEQALVINRETGNRRGESADLGNLGIAYYRLGEARKAIEFHEQALVISREIGDRRGEGIALSNMGEALYDLQEKDRAIQLVKEALEIFEAIESPNADEARKKLEEWGAL